MDKILVATATYNEADNIGHLIDEVSQVLPAADVLVIDDNSQDGTKEILDEMSRTKSFLKVIHRPRKLGLGTAHKLAMKFAISNHYAALITMDADFSHNPKYLPTMVEKLKNHDFVIGSRYVQGGHCDYKLARVLLSQSANFLARLLLGIKLKETTTSFRGFKTELLKKIDIDSLKSQGYSFFFEAVYRISKVTQSLTEFPIYFEDRRAGTSKISKKEIWLAIWRLFSLFMGRLKGSHKNFRAYDAKTYDFCNVCQSPFHVELYPSTSHNETPDQYKCSANNHFSHGRIVQCLGCGLIYTNPCPSSDKITEIYNQVVDPIYEKNVPSRFQTFEYNFKQIKPFLPPSGRLLDVGSYCGVFLEVAKNKGYQVQGVEPSQWACDFARRKFGVSVFHGTLADPSFNEKNFDIVTSWDALEHFTDPMSELGRINNRLKLNGIFAFSTLNIKNWFPRLLKDKWPWMMDMHLYYFDNQVIEHMLSQAGFKLLHAQSYCHIITAEYFFYKLESLKVWGAKYLKWLVRKTPFKNFYLPFRFGDIQLFVAQKINSASPETFNHGWRTKKSLNLGFSHKAQSMASNTLSITKNLNCHCVKNP